MYTQKICKGQSRIIKRKIIRTIENNFTVVIYGYKEIFIKQLKRRKVIHFPTHICYFVKGMYERVGEPKEETFTIEND